MPLHSNVKSALCEEYNKRVQIKESFSTDERNSNKFPNPPQCSDNDCECRKCKAAGWGGKEQRWKTI